MVHKSVNEIFKERLDLLENPQVKELVHQYENLAEEIIEEQQKGFWSKEQPLKELFIELKDGVIDLSKQEDESIRWPNEFEKPDFRGAIMILKNRLKQFSKDYNI